MIVLKWKSKKKLFAFDIIILLVLMSLFLCAKEKNVLAVLDLKGEGISISEARIITGFLQEAMFKTKKYELIERTQVEQILKEFEYQQSGICDIKCAVNIGKQLAANKVLIGTVGKLGTLYTIQVKILDIELGKIEKMDSIRTNCKIGELPDYILTLVKKLIGVNESHKKYVELKNENQQSDYDIEELGIEWVKIQKGEFKRDYRQKVYLDTYFISQYEVTFKQFDKYCEDKNINKPKDQGGRRANYPVAFISWEEASDFCNWLSRKTGKNIHLPTEAQWEKACLGGSEKKRYGKIKSIAWYKKNSSGRTHPVGQLMPNKYGLYDMLGNVWEWCLDWYSESYINNSPYRNPKGPANGFLRVIRGGSYLNSSMGITTKFRNEAAPTKGFSAIGFRLAMDIPIGREE